MTIVFHPRLCALAWVILALLGPVGATAAGCNSAVSCCDKPPTGVPQCPAGNPIDVTSGNKYQREQDMPALPGVLGLELVRHYNSADAQANERGILGRGWRLGYDEELLAGPGDNSLTLVLGDGARMRFFRGMLQPDAGRTVFVPDRSSLLRVHMVHTRSGIEYGLRLADGLHVFDGQGKLVRIEARTGEVLTLQRDRDGWLQRVTDPQGRSLVLHYQSGSDATGAKRYSGVASIDTPVGRFSYTYGSPAVAASRATPSQLVANLASAGLPPAPAAPGQPEAKPVRRVYHYEDSRHFWALTGITVQGAGSDGRAIDERIVTWGYDPRGRANLSVRGRYDPGKPGIEQVDLVFDGPRADGTGETVLTNSVGQVTRYRYARIQGQTQLLGVRGAGCASCGLVNVRYAYDSRGRPSQAIRLDAQGRPRMAEITTYDGAGRVRQVSELRYDQGRPGPERMRVRYQYGDDVLDPQPVLIARPSVVAGQEHVVRITYNDKGQPTEVTESGFSPLDEGGHPVAEGVPIRRTTRYAYAEVNRRSVLVGMDGPLANGPKGSPIDSDVVRLVWDASGNYMVSLEEPGGKLSRFEHSPSGHVVEVRNDEGATTRFFHAADGQLRSVAHADASGSALQVDEFLRDALGRVSESRRASSAEPGRPLWRQEFDAAGRLLWHVSSLGMVERRTYDTEGQPLLAGRYSARIAQEIRQEFDGQGRLRSMTDASGGRYRFTYGPGGEPHIEDGFGEIGPVRSGDPGSMRDRAPTLDVLDDFGRAVATVGADSGRLLRDFDSADRLVRSRDAVGNEAVYAYDLRGRILRQAITAPDGVRQETRWNYSGSRLSGVEHPLQDELYAYDERGLRISKIVVRKDVAHPWRSVTRYVYDVHHELQAMSLPDGTWVDYERNGQGQVVALRHHALRKRWLHWAQPPTRLVEGLERDLVGLRAYRTGNGIAAEYQRSAAGVLARIVYRSSPLASPDKEMPPRLAQAARAQSMPVPVVPVAAGALSPGALGEPGKPDALVDHRYLWDTRGNLLHQQEGGGPQVLATGYAYDWESRLVASAGPSGFSRYAYDAASRRVLSQTRLPGQDSMAGTVALEYASPGAHRWTRASVDGTQLTARHDENGQPVQVGTRHYGWDALGRLTAIREGQRVVATYAYSHRGERIGKTVADRTVQYLYEDRRVAAELDAGGRVRREYLYLADLPMVVIDHPEGAALADPEAPGSLLRDLGTLLRAWTGQSEGRTVWLHPNHLGAPELATDGRGAVVWRASYAPFGQAKAEGAGFELQLRLPGQYEDAESGLFYNGQRYYDPERGLYLTPDPLGAPDGTNAYAYVRHNPLKSVDPQGLVLFAFDGTDNTDDEKWLAAHQSSASNVVKFRSAVIGDWRYVTGVGTDHAGRDKYPDIIAANYTGLKGQIPDRGGNYSGPARIERMMRYLEEEADAAADNVALDLDIIGFSRGAAEARDFANRVVQSTSKGWYRYIKTSRDLVSMDPVFSWYCQRVNFRFMGLWDTVLSTNLSGVAYQLAIPPEFKYVAQAVALNEYRSAPAGVDAYYSAKDNFVFWDSTRVRLPRDDHYGAFPLVSIGPSSASPSGIRIERGFIGAHADIGGGYAEGENALSSVSLSWMVAQAELAGLKFEPGSTQIDMGNPVIHDQSNAMRVGDPRSAPPFRVPFVSGGTLQYPVEDRTVLGGLGTGFGRGQTFGPPGKDGSTSMTNADTHRFISYTPRESPVGPKATNDIPSVRVLGVRTGTVDMVAYLAWLRQHGYSFSQGVQ